MVALRPAAAPVATGPFESTRMPLILPLPVAAAVVRWVDEAGAVQVTAEDDFSV